MERSRCVDMKEHIGERFGRLVIVGIVRDEKRKRNHVVCKCDCGGGKVCQYIHLKRGKTKSCGCIERERVESARARNGASKEERAARCRAMREEWERKREERRRNAERRKETARFTKEHKKLFYCWQGMKQRCTRKTHHKYPNYGARGIAVCEEWMHNFMAFATWSILNGYRDGLQIDRIDDNGNYEPSNCRWVTAMENGNNKRNNLWLKDADGNVKTCAEWARIRGIRYETMHESWMKKGYVRVEYGA